MFMITRKKRAKKNYSDTLFVLAEMTQDSVVIGEIYALILYGIFYFFRLFWFTLTMATHKIVAKISNTFD